MCTVDAVLALVAYTLTTGCRSGKKASIFKAIGTPNDLAGMAATISMGEALDIFSSQPC